MESYQIMGIIMGVAGIVIAAGMFSAGFFDVSLIWISFWSPITGILSFIGIIVAFASPRYKRGVGIYYLIAGIISNLLLIVPAIMAFRYKPEVKVQ